MIELVKNTIVNKIDFFFLEKLNWKGDHRRHFEEKVKDLTSQ